MPSGSAVPWLQFLVTVPSLEPCDIAGACRSLVLEPTDTGDLSPVVHVAIVLVIPVSLLTGEQGSKGQCVLRDPCLDRRGRPAGRGLVLWLALTS